MSEEFTPKEQLRVFVAGGSRSGNDELYVEEAYNLGRQIVKMDLCLDFGLSNSGIMGAVARGVIDGWKTKQGEAPPIQGITTKEYYSLYPQDDTLLNSINNVFLVTTLEERKQKLLESDFIVFAPGGVGTLDELAYDCVAMQDGFLQKKPFIIYNINGFFHHILEFLKQICLRGFADPIPFIVVNSSEEIGVIFRLLKLRYTMSSDFGVTYAHTRKLIYEAPYFLKKRDMTHAFVEDIIAEMENIRKNGTEEENKDLDNEIEQAYLEDEIERMYERLAITGKNTVIVSDKLTKLKQRKKKWK